MKVSALNLCDTNYLLATVLVVIAILTTACGGGSSSRSSSQNPGPGCLQSPTAPPPPTPTPITGLTLLSEDKFTNCSSQHSSEVEPSAASSQAGTIVTAFQVGRIFSGGGADIGYNTSTDGGTTWMNPAGLLPGITVFAGGNFNAVSDVSVAFNNKFSSTWLASTLGISATDQVLVSTSPDGISWNNPVPVSFTVNADKNWIACDNSPISPHEGNCYVEWDDTSTPMGVINMSTSTDGGKTWSPARNTADVANGLGGQPLIEPNGTVVVPYLDWTTQFIKSFVSTDGGTSWSASLTVSDVQDHAVLGESPSLPLRTLPLPSAAVDAVAGTVYVVWQDCRYRISCESNDIVMTSSTDGGATWSNPPARIPIDVVTSSADHFIVGLGIDPLTTAPNAHLGLTYYFYPDARCTGGCQLEAGFIGSTDSGSTWDASPTTLTPTPMQLTWLPNTFSGLMVADYIATAFAFGRAFPVLAVAEAPAGSELDQQIYTSSSGLPAAASSVRVSSAGEFPVPEAQSDHPMRRFFDVEPGEGPPRE